MTRCWAPCVVALGCAATPAPVVHAPVQATVSAPEVVDAAALDALMARLRGDAGAEVLGVDLPRSRGARSLSGEPAPDDRVRDVSVVARVDASAAVFVTTACGNAWLVGMHFEHGRWSPVEHVAAVGDARPGGCRVTRAHATACAMMARETRELVVVFSSESEEGDVATDPALRVFHLTPEGALHPMSDEIALGGTDDNTGAVRDAQWVVDDNFPIPRELYVQIQPGRAGPGGAAPPFVVRRTYRVQGERLVLAEETSARMRASMNAPSTMPASQ